MKNNAIGTMVIGGKERPYHVNGTRQTKQFTDTLGIELDEYWQKMSEFAAGLPMTNSVLAIAYVWSALYAGQYRATRSCDFTYDDVVDWVEDMEGDEATAEFLKPFQALQEIVEQKKS
jgi:hypothetical protein